MKRSEEESAVEPDESHVKDADQPTLTAIQQVGDDRADMLREAGYTCVEDVATADQSALTDIDGVGECRADQIVESAKQLLHDHGGTATPSPTSPESSTTRTETEATTEPEDDTPTLMVEFSPESEDPARKGGNSRAEIDGDETTGVLTSARTSIAEVVRRVRGHARMVFDRRVLDPRAYGATEDWTALAFETDTEPVRELLEETVYIGEVPVETTGEPPADRPGGRLSAETSVRFPREGIEQVENAARAGKPEAKRTVTLLRRALRTDEDRAIHGSGQ